VIAHGLQFEVHDVLVKGPIWDLTIVVVVSDHALGPDGQVQYENRAAEYYRVRWGKVQSCEVFEDTEKATAWDRALGVASV
jgi:ketosteroid isomerase-like protein